MHELYLHIHSKEKGQKFGNTFVSLSFHLNCHSHHFHLVFILLKSFFKSLVATIISLEPATLKVLEENFADIEIGSEKDVLFAEGLFYRQLCCVQANCLFISSYYCRTWQSDCSRDPQWSYPTLLSDMKLRPLQTIKPILLTILRVCDLLFSIKLSPFIVKHIYLLKP